VFKFDLISKKCLHIFPSQIYASSFIYILYLTI